MSSKPVPVLLCLMAFLAALAFAMLSRNALEDLDTFRACETSGFSSWLPISEAAEVADDALDTVEEGEGTFDEKTEDVFLVFLIDRGRVAGLMSVSDGPVKAPLRERRDFDGFVDNLLVPYMLVLTA